MTIRYVSKYNILFSLAVYISLLCRSTVYLSISFLSLFFLHNVYNRHVLKQLDNSEIHRSQVWYPIIPWCPVTHMCHWLVLCLKRIIAKNQTLKIVCILICILISLKKYISFLFEIVSFICEKWKALHVESFYSFPWIC